MAHALSSLRVFAEKWKITFANDKDICDEFEARAIDERVLEVIAYVSPKGEIFKRDPITGALEDKTVWVPIAPKELEAWDYRQDFLIGTDIHMLKIWNAMSAEERIGAIARDPKITEQVCRSGDRVVARLGKLPTP